MAISSVVLSPEYLNVGRFEALNTTADQRTGTFVTLGADGKFASTAVGAKRTFILIENVSTAQGVEYRYAADELAFAAHLPVGCRVGAAAGSNVEYAVGTEVEIGNNGLIVPVTTGEPVGVVTKTVKPQVGELIEISLV